MAFRPIFLSLLIVLTIQNVFSQNVEQKPNAEFSAETRKQAVELLREAAGDANNLRTLENRIGFASELAGLMWFEDEKQARAMYGEVINDFRQLVAQYQTELMSFGETPDDANDYQRGGLFGGGNSSQKSQARRRLSRAMDVRRQIATSIAEHDGQFALDFYASSAPSVPNAAGGGRSRYNQEDYFEAQLLGQIAAQNAGKALDYGKKSLAKGFNYAHIQLMKKIYAKDADKGAEFADALVARVKEEKVSEEDFYQIRSLLNEGDTSFEATKKSGAKPMMSEQNLRDTAEKLAQMALESKSESYDGESYIATIEKYAPARGAQLRAKFQQPAARSNQLRSPVRAVAIGAPPPPPPPLATIVRGQSATPATLDDLKNIGGASKEEREKTVAQARQTIAAMPDRQVRLAALNGLAIQVFKAGDQETAAAIMGDAQELISLQPKNYRDYTEILLLTTGYAQTAPEKAFPVLENTILRLNDTLDAFVKVGEFMDTEGEIIDDGEVRLGVFGGSMVRSLSGGLGAADQTLRLLALKDFVALRRLTNSFNRTEIRVMAKILVLRAVFSERKPPEENEKM